MKDLESQRAPRHTDMGMVDDATAAAGTGGDPMIGRVLHDRYKLTTKLGEGGMGVVYGAEHVHIKKRFAVKLLRKEIVTNDEAVARFKQEAYSASSINHKNIIEISDFGELDDGRIYLCMEFLDGKPLSDLLSDNIELDRLLNILIQTAHGLAAAHRAGIIHRDMKPENIFVTELGTGDVPKLLDFGIAKVSGHDGQNNLTRTGTIFGTPYYMAPEQALGQAVDWRADVYALGVIMYEMFAGTVPFEGDSFMGILTQHITTSPESVEERAQRAGRTIPPGIVQIINRSMAKKPEERFSSMDEMLEALVACHQQLVGPGMSGYMHPHNVPSNLGGIPAPGQNVGHLSGQMMQSPHGGQQRPESQPGHPQQGYNQGHISHGSQQRPGSQPGHPQQAYSQGHISHGGQQQDPNVLGRAGTDPNSGQMPQMGHQRPDTSGFGQTMAADSSAWAVAAPKKSKALPLTLLAILLLGGGGGAFWYFSMRQPDEAQAASQDDSSFDSLSSMATSSMAVVSSSASSDASTSAAETSSSSVVSSADSSSNVAEKIVVVDSNITAKVYRDGDKIGTTPLVVRVPEGDTIKLELKASGYYDRDIEVGSSKSKVKFSLRRQKRSSSSKSSKSSKPVSSRSSSRKSSQSSSRSSSRKSSSSSKKGKCITGTELACLE